MTTLTRILLNPARRKGRRYLSDPQDLHAAVRAAFPPDLDESNGRILWRVDTRGHENILYIVGPEAPTPLNITEEAGWDTRPPQLADYDRFLDKLMNGQRWMFELVANPTYSESRGQGKRGKVKAHVSPEQQLQWLVGKSSRHGFTIREDATSVVERSRLDFYRNYEAGPDNRNRVRIVTARFRGILQITDVKVFRETMRNGIGRGRGYGCGLLTLAPVESSESE
ncbi:type I-E CRISPR-associated protein Cas6/Cse3/CasE [Corynebacterium phoceense]|uniref:type I-E CRISPR-associated protein Cas6/Cse3/CasE n=1 Tax=Corynebacterium phoceense TaxID=1686286 RepID=UPI00211C2279|nr:type I-E CRISPR-associated protein Cas6/Cse3/CasE [Corynebacterium phoceense]MCQ9336128.1 type I-E CRISPR-associated protein Cas6/Cse3/CasE [Corynebacterium phoceense]